MTTPKEVTDIWAMMREVTIRTVACMPEDRLDYTPSPTCRPFREIVVHMLQAGYLMADCISGQQASHQFKVEDFPTRASLEQALRDGRDYVMRHVPHVSRERLDVMQPTPLGTEAMPVRHWLMALLLHEAEHRGNLAVLAKAAGAVPPDIGEVRRQMMG